TTRRWCYRFWAAYVWLLVRSPVATCGTSPWNDGRMRFGPKLEPGDRVAVVSPSFGAPGFAPGVHEQAMRRVVSELELQPVEYPSTRQIDAPARTRADDINAALADPGIRAVFATLGGDDQITVLPYLDANAARDNP